jgi:hypothetical protein
MVMSEPAAPAEDGRSRPGAMRGWRQHSLFWAGVTVVPYLLVTLGVAAVEYFSEMSKLSRGFYTDTFSPFFYTHILTFPTSALHSDWPGYPEVFDRVQWESIVQHAVGPVVLTVVIQAALLAAGVLLVVDQTDDRR